MTKEEILNYVMNTPENTNRMVLNDMLDKLVNSSGGGSDNFDVVFTYTRGERETVVVSDKTFDEAAAAISAGKHIRAELRPSTWPSDGTIRDLSTNVDLIDGDVDTIWFLSAPEVDEGGIEQIGIEWTDYAGLELWHVVYPKSEPEPEPSPGPIV
jgi:hypothetical protein